MTVNGLFGEDYPPAARSSRNSNRSARTHLTYVMPGSVVYSQRASRVPSPRAIARAHQPRYRSPSSWSTRTARGGSKRRTSCTTDATVRGQKALVGMPLIFKNVCQIHVTSPDNVSHKDRRSTTPSTGALCHASGSPEGQMLLLSAWPDDRNAGTRGATRASSRRRRALDEGRAHDAGDDTPKGEGEQENFSAVRSSTANWFSLGRCGVLWGFMPTAVDTGSPQAGLLDPPTCPQVVQKAATPGAGPLPAFRCTVMGAGSRPGSQPTPAPRSPADLFCQADTEPPMSVPAEPCPVDGDPDPERAAAIEAVEIAVVARHENPDDAVLRYVFRCAHRTLSVADLAAISHYDEPFVTRLLEEAG